MIEIGLSLFSAMLRFTGTGTVYIPSFKFNDVRNSVYLPLTSGF